MAFHMAGLKVKDVDVAELYDCYTFTVLMTLEDYGFCAKGEAGPVEGIDGRVARRLERDLGAVAPGRRTLVGGQQDDGLLEPIASRDVQPAAPPLAEPQDAERAGVRLRLGL